MKKAILTIFTFSSFVLNAQNFEGILTYSVDFDINSSLKKMGMSKEMLLKDMKNNGTWSNEIMIYYKNGNYYSVMQDDSTTYSIYRNDSNKVYTAFQNNKAAIVDASIDNEQKMTKHLPTIQFIDTAAFIYGQSCKIVRVQWQSGFYDYYFKSNYLSMNANFYRGHILDGWYDYLKISNALPLKIVKDTKGVIVTMTLKNVIQTTLDPIIFKVPNLFY